MILMVSGCVTAAVKGSGRLQPNCQTEGLDSKNLRIKVCSVVACMIVTILTKLWKLWPTDSFLKSYIVVWLAILFAASPVG